MALDMSFSLSPGREPAAPWRRAVLGRLGGLGAGTLAVVEGGETVVLGAPAPDGLAGRIAVHDPRFWRRVALGGSVAAGASYADGEWDADDLTSVVRILARNVDVLDGVERGLARLARPAAALFRLLRRNTRDGARRNIADHYDLGNDFFALMLDRTMTYSSGIFDPPEGSLEEASLRKLDLLCRKLDLRPPDHLVEIGTGWGSMAIHAASRYGCRVTTTTISRAQWELARERVLRAGLADRVTVLLSDYRDLGGRYDKLVSIEMIEAIGADQYETLFGKIGGLLGTTGVAAIQAITFPDQRYDQHRRQVDFIKRYIFPGSNIPSISAMVGAATRASDLTLRHLEDFTPHYARTLAAWRANLEARSAEVAKLADVRFRRLWRFYLCYCEGGFAERAIGVVQLVFGKPGAR